MNPTVSAITLGVSDVNRARRFYEDGFRFKVATAADVFVSLRMEGVATMIGLYSTQSLAADAGSTPRGSGFRGIALSFIVTDADEVDATVACACAAGGTVVKKPRSHLWGGYTGYIADPDGHLWKIGANHRPSLLRAQRSVPSGAVAPPPKETAVTLGCRDIKQAKEFYSAGLGFVIDKSFGKFVSFKSDAGIMPLSLYTWDALADDGGVEAVGDGFRATTLSYVVESVEQVDEVLRAAAEAGASTTAPHRTDRGGYGGHFTDPAGHLWKVAARA